MNVVGTAAGVLLIAVWTREVVQRFPRDLEAWARESNRERLTTAGIWVLTLFLAYTAGRLVLGGLASIATLF